MICFIETIANKISINSLNFSMFNLNERELLNKLTFLQNYFYLLWIIIYFWIGTDLILPFIKYDKITYRSEQITEI